MNVVNIYESQLYLNDDDFTDAEEKDEYYGWKFWIDSDFIIIPNYDMCRYDFYMDTDAGEIIVRDDYIPDEVEEALIRFSGDNFKDYFIELNVGNHVKLEDNAEYDPKKPFIKYRGGSGYWYAHHQYKYDI